ncbi:MAG: AraC family transcriptional regulator [Bacteroidales bacterium]|nr:AraC family transcriptional regulator [Bacteroidales bacterium]
MESDRCITMVKKELDRLGLNYKNVELGVVELNEQLADEQILQFEAAIRNIGFELLENKSKCLVEKIKVVVCQYINHPEELQKQNFSDYIRGKVNYDYTCLSNLFSSVEGITIEKYIIEQRIERVKELLANIELTISDISFKMQYSSLAHLSNQFKKVTGFTPSDFRRLWSNSQKSF